MGNRTRKCVTVETRSEHGRGRNLPHKYEMETENRRALHGFAPCLIEKYRVCYKIAFGIGQLQNDWRRRYWQTFIRTLHRCTGPMVFCMVSRSYGHVRFRF